MKKVGYFVVAIVSLLTLLIGVLYVRYSTQSEAIHSTVDSFIEESRSGTTESLLPYVHPAFVEQLIGFINEKGQLFRRVVSVDERDWYFSYNWNSDVGETTEYHGIVTWDTGDTGDYDLKLIKNDGQWVVYGINIQPHTTD